MSVTKNNGLTVGFSAVIRSVLVMLCLSFMSAAAEAT